MANNMEIRFGSIDIDALLKRNSELLPDCVAESLMRPDRIVSFGIIAQVRDKASLPEDGQKIEYLRWGILLSLVGYMISVYLALKAAFISPGSMPVASWLYDNTSLLFWMVGRFGIFLGYLLVGHFATGGLVALVGLVLGKKPVLYGYRYPLVVLMNRQ